MKKLLISVILLTVILSGCASIPWCTDDERCPAWCKDENGQVFSQDQCGAIMAEQLEMERGR
jgi:uncharacterized protein YceK